MTQEDEEGQLDEEEEEEDIFNSGYPGSALVY